MEKDNHEERLKIDAINGFKQAKKIMNGAKISLAFLSGASTISGIVSVIACIKNKNIYNQILTIGLSIIAFLLSYYLKQKAIVCHNHSKECDIMIENITKELNDIKEENRKGK